MPEPRGVALPESFGDYRTKLLIPYIIQETLQIMIVGIVAGVAQFPQY